MAEQLNLTPFRRRCLALLDQLGPLDMQEIGYLLVDGTTSKGFRHPASATRFGGGVYAPLVRAGLVERTSERNGFRNRYRITAHGRAALRQAASA